MPTGFTEKVQSGEISNLYDYALQFVVGIGKPVPEHIEPDISRLDENIARACEKLAALRALTEEQAEHRLFEEWSKRRHTHALERHAAAQQRERCESMLAQAEAWQPPSPEHGKLRAFMLEQLREAIRSDCCNLEVPERMTGVAWLAARIADVEGDLAYWSTKRTKEIEQAAERTLWLQELRRSLS